MFRSYYQQQIKKTILYQTHTFICYALIYTIQYKQSTVLINFALLLVLMREWEPILDDCSPLKN